jgi:hypothetical protein
LHLESFNRADTREFQTSIVQMQRYRCHLGRRRLVDTVDSGNCDRWRYKHCFTMDLSDMIVSTNFFFQRKQITFKIFRLRIYLYPSILIHVSRCFLKAHENTILQVTLEPLVHPNARDHFNSDTWYVDDDRILLQELSLVSFGWATDGIFESCIRIFVRILLIVRQRLLYEYEIDWSRMNGYFPSLTYLNIQVKSVKTNYRSQCINFFARNCKRSS